MLAHIANNINIKIQNIKINNDTTNTIGKTIWLIV